MHLNTVIGTSPRHSKQSLKTVLSQGGNGSASVGHTSSNGKKTTGSYKQDGDNQLVLGSNNLILSRGRPAQMESTARAAASMPTAGQMNYSKTLTQHMQNQHSNAGGFHSGKSKGLQKRVQGTSTTQLNQTISSQKKSLHNRNGSTNNQTAQQNMVSAQATPQRSSETLNSKIKKKKRALANTNSFQQTSNSNSRGNLLISHNQLSYLKQSQQLQEARNNRDSIGAKKSLKSNASMKKSGALNAHQAATQSVVSQSGNNTSQTQLNVPTGTIKVGITGISDSSFNNMTIRSGDKYNSNLGPVKRSSGHKQRQISNLEQQVLTNAQMQLAHPLSAKNTQEKPKNIFQAQGQNNNASSTQNLNQSNQNLIQGGFKNAQLPTGASKHYLNGTGSMIELSTAVVSGAPQPSGTSKNAHSTNLNSANVFQRSHHQIYHSKNQSIGGVSYSSNNSRFTTTRPKNPTDGSLSSKGSIDSAANHFGVSTNNRLKQKLSQQQQSQQNQNNVGAPTANVQCVSLQIDPDYLTNKSISPQKTTIQASQVQYATGKGTNSKFNLVNRGVLNAGQFPAVVNANRSGVLSPKSQNGGGRLISQSMSNQNFMKGNVAGSGSANVNSANKNGGADFQSQQAPASNQKRKLSMKLSQQQLQPSGQSQEILQQTVQQQQQFLTQQAKEKSLAQSSKNLAAGSEHSVKEIIQTPNHGKEESMHHTNASINKSSHQAGPSQQQQTAIVMANLIPASEAKTNKTMTHEVITEEQVEDSAHNTKRQSIEHQNSVPVGKTIASASAPNLNQSSSTAKVKTVNLTKDTPVSKQLTSLRQQLKTQITKQTSHQARSQNGDQATSFRAQDNQDGQLERTDRTQNSIKDIANSSQYNSNPQQPSSAIGVNEVHFPMSSRQALQLFQNQGMTDYEKIEIQNYQEVYFVGLEAKKIKASSLLGHNFGFDDERGDYQVVMKDHLAYRFEVLEKLGSGSFGQALKCFDHKTQTMVAIKVIRNKKRFQHQAGVELRLLRYLKQKDKNDENNIVRILDYAIFRKHLLLSFELLSMNLYEFIKQNNFQGVSTGLIRRFAIQILQALKFQRDHAIIHCDLKPENILLKQPNKSGIKIIDYGSSCFQFQRIYTYIQSRFYRAPEIILGIPYTTSIDMWSFGCIMAELYTGYPLFPGENEAEQLAYVMEIKGVPPDYIIELSTRRNLFFEKDSFYPIIVTNSRGRRRLPNTKTLQNVLKKCQDAKFLDFIDQCLDWDPVNRMTPLEALQHEWILEGLPEKVLVHHQRMFGGKDDKINLKEASLTAVQGFPEEANTKTIYDIVAELRAEDNRKERRGHKGVTSEQARSELIQHNQSTKDIMQIKKTASVQNVQSEPKGYESVPTKTPNRSEYHSSKILAANQSTQNKHKSLVIQAQQVQQQSINKTEGGDDAAPEKAHTESPSKHRKIIRGFQQSKSTKVLAPNTVQLEKTIKPVNTNNLTTLTEASEKKKHRDLVDNKTQQSNVTAFKQLTANASQAQMNSLELQSYESSVAKPLGKNRGKIINFDNNQSQDSAAFTETVTEAQDHAKSPVDQQSDELSKAKKKALIPKTQSQLPLKTVNKLIVKDESCVADDLEVENASASEHPETKIKSGSVVLSSDGNLQGQNHMELSNGGASGQMQPQPQHLMSELPKSLSHPGHNEEDDYEDMMTPTDDEGITSLNHTQKIPISLIKAKDKASKLFQPIPSHQQQARNIKHVAGSQGEAEDGDNNNNYYFASYGGKSQKSQSGSSHQQASLTGKKQRVEKLKVQAATAGVSSQNESLTPKQAMMIAAMQSKGMSKLSHGTGNSSSKGSTQSKVPSSTQRNEYLSTQQTKHQYVSGGAAQAHNNSSTRSHQKEAKYNRSSHQDDGGENNGPGSQSFRPHKEQSKVILASSSGVQLSAARKNAGSQSNNNMLQHRSK